MQLSDIQTKVYQLTKTNATSYPNTSSSAGIPSMLVDLNIASSHVNALIATADGRWEWDDSNYTDFPTATTALVANQQDYSLSVAHLSIERIEVLPSGGKYFYKLFPRAFEDPMWGANVTGIDTVTVGTPIKYDVSGESVFLYPIPNYSQAASLKIYYKRAGYTFTSTDLSTGTLQPGWASIFHDLLAYLVAYDYAVINLPALAAGYWATIQRKEAALLSFYGTRNKDDGPRLSMKPISFR
jgi:hypothetical protein